MESEKWLQELFNKLRERLGEEYQVTKVDKPALNSAGKVQIGIVKNGERTGILLNLGPGKVQRLKTGIGLKEEAGFLVERYLEKRSALRRELLAGEWFERMKERIVYALERMEGNEEALKHIPWEPYLDMAIVFYLVETPGGDTNYRVISNHDLEVWKVSKEEIFQIAKENTPRLGVPLLLTPEDAVGENKEGEEESLKDMEGYLLKHTYKGVSAFVLTNQYGLYGASVILYDGLLERIAWAWRDDVLVIPSSINEVMIVPACGSTKTIQQWREIVKEMNQEEPQKEMALSDSVYFYDHKEGKLCIATDDYKMLFD